MNVGQRDWVNIEAIRKPATLNIHPIVLNERQAAALEVFWQAREEILATEGIQLIGPSDVELVGMVQTISHAHRHIARPVPCAPTVVGVSHAGRSSSAFASRRGLVGLS